MHIEEIIEAAKVAPDTSGFVCKLRQMQGTMLAGER